MAWSFCRRVYEIAFVITDRKALAARRLWFGGLKTYYSHMTKQKLIKLNSLNTSTGECMPIIYDL